MSQEADYRLPRTVIPSRYELDLAPDLTAFEFTGAATVDVEVMAPVEEVVLNAADLQIDTVDLVDAAGTAMRGDVAYDPDAERAAFRFPQTVTPGKWKLQVTFRGTLNDQLQGFYRSTYRDPDGNERVLASTQFEATDARRAFPCWDCVRRR
jgi:puromycin-sensitive aminopeptidase